MDHRAMVETSCQQEMYSSHIQIYLRYKTSGFELDILIVYTVTREMIIIKWKYLAVRSLHEQLK